jgi:hypothetical protein
MPIRYELDDLRRRVVVTIDGAFQTEDVLAIMARQRAEHTWTYAILYDLRGMTGDPTVDELRQLTSEAAELREGEGPRGPVALGPLIRPSTDDCARMRARTINDADDRCVSRQGQRRAVVDG